MIYTWYSVVRQHGASCIINRVDEDVGASFCQTNNNYVIELKKKKLKRYIHLLNKFIIATPCLVILKFSQKKLMRYANMRYANINIYNCG